MEYIKQNSANTCVVVKEDNKEPIVDNKKPANISYKTLKLKKEVRWTEDTIDNEFLNRKKSKSRLCLI
jgi:hypothetical protein